MADENRNQPTTTSYEDDGGRPHVDSLDKQKPQYRPGDSVYYINEGTGAQEGPYVVASLPEAGKCKLVHPDGGEELISTDALVNAG